MIKNIITPGSNTGERAILREAQKQSVTTGRFLMELRQPTGRIITCTYKGQVNCDLDHLRVADLTVLIIVDDLLPAGKKRRDRIWGKRHCRRVIEVFVVGEQASVVRECHLLDVEVLNFICIQQKRDCPAATRLVTDFLADFLEEASQIFEKNASAIWKADSRFKQLRKHFYPGPVVNFTRTNNNRFLPGVVQLARERIFQAVIELPIDGALKRRIIADAINNFETELKKMVASDICHDGWFEKLWQPCVIRTVSKHIKSFPNEPIDDLNKLVNQFESKWEQFEPYWKPVESNQQNEKFRQMCEIAADTRLREDRYLRTLVLLFLGGIYQSKVTSEIVGGCMTAHEKINRDFSEVELSRRFQAVDGWDAVIESGKANHYDRQDDPFLEIARTRDDERLEAELFYKADEFRRCQELWDPNWVAAFCHSLCFLCGSEKTLWRSWIGPPKR